MTVWCQQKKTSFTPHRTKGEVTAGCWLMIYPGGHWTRGLKGTATQGPYQVTDEKPRLAAPGAMKDCDTVSSLTSALQGRALGEWGLGKSSVLQCFSQNSWACQKTPVPISLSFSLAVWPQVTLWSPLRLGGFTCEEEVFTLCSWGWLSRVSSTAHVGAIKR